MPNFTEDPTLSIGDETRELMKLVWPNYLIEPSDIADPSLVFKLPMTEVKRRSPSMGIRDESSGQLVAAASALLVHVGPNADSLPNDGWSFAMKSAMSAEPPDAICLLAINVHPNYQGLGLAEHLIGWAKEMTAELGFSQLIGPVRPILKEQFADMPIDQYVGAKTSDGRILDPWLRLHARLGADIMNVCHKSVIVRATLERWRKWTGLALTKSGNYHIPRGLAPLKVDIDSDVGEYVEPNVWVRYHS